MVAETIRPRAPASLFEWQDFVLATAARELRARYARSLFGWLWLVLPPAVLIAIYTLVFSRLMRSGGSLPDRGPYTYALYLCAGLLTWQWFADLLSRVVGVFTNNAAMLKKTAVPWHALLAADALVATFGLAVQMILFALFLAVLGQWPGAQAVLFIPLLLCQALLALGLGIALAVVQVFFRDVGLALPLVLQVWFWLTPIVYPLDALPAAAQEVLRWNPLQPLAQGFQNIVVAPDAGVPWARVAWVAGVAAILLVLALRLARRNSGLIRDEL
jgi:lipopolysaccharide transport system permease protein